MTTARRARAVTLGDAPRARAACAKPSPVRSGSRAGLHASRLTPVDSRTGWQCAGRSDRLPSRSVERRDREPRRRPSWCTHPRAYRTGVSVKKGLGLRFVEAQARAQIVSAAAPLYHIPTSQAAKASPGRHPPGPPLLIPSRESRIRKPTTPATATIRGAGARPRLDSAPATASRGSCRRGRAR